VAGNSVKSALRNHSLDSPSKFHTINKLTEKNRITSFLNFKISNKISFIPNYNYHASALQLKNELPPMIWDTFFKFAFVRNPWDLNVSLYHYMLRSKTHSQHEHVKSMKTFKEFIEHRVSVIENSKGAYHKQIDMLGDLDGKLLVNFVGKMENIQNDFSKICKNIGIETPQIPKINTSQHKNYRDYYDEYTKELVARCFVEDIKLFNYQF
jgi:hypothetical protein